MERIGNGLAPRDVALQDQHTPTVIAFFNQVEESTTLAVATAIGDRTITLTSTTGAAVGKYIILFHPASERFYTGHITSIAALPVVSVDTPLDFAYPIGTFIDIAITDMSVDGSSTTQVFGLRGVGVPPGIDLRYDVTRLMFQCEAASPVSLATFADLTALTNGLVCRKRDGEYHNILNVKTNKELAGIMYDWTPYAATNPQQGQDGFVGRLTFAGQNKIGVTQRLALGEDLEFLIQDDLRAITELKIIAEGHRVED